MQRSRMTSKCKVGKRKFDGFASTVAPTSETLYQYEVVTGTPLVQHKSLTTELAIVLVMLEAEARSKRKRYRSQELVAILSQFVVESTHPTPGSEIYL